MKINSVVNLIVVCVSILAIIAISACIYKSESTTEGYSTTGNNTSLAVHFNYSYNSIEGVYHVKGSIKNEGTTTAHNISVMLSFTDRNGSVLHQKRMQIGDINSSEEKSVSYDWAGPEGANLDTIVYQDIEQLLPDSNSSYHSEINWGF